MSVGCPYVPTERFSVVQRIPSGTNKTLINKDLIEVLEQNDLIEVIKYKAGASI